MSALPLYNLVKTAVGIAFDLAGEVVKACVYHNVTGANYNADTGTPTNVETTFNADIIFRKLTIDEKKNNALADLVGIAKASEITATPNLDDYILDTSGVRYELHAWELEPTGNVYKLFVRRVVA